VGRRGQGLPSGIYLGARESHSIPNGILCCSIRNSVLSPYSSPTPHPHIACSAPVRLTAKYRPGVPILVLTKNQAVASACSIIRAAVTLVLGEQEEVLERSDLVRLVSTFCREPSR